MKEGVDKLEDTLNGGFAGLYSEVVTCDSYKIRQLKFTPDVVIDLGANVGAFTRFARELFPKATIVSVEPDYENYGHLVNFTNPHLTVFYNLAVGEGAIVRRVDSNSLINGAHASYLPEQLADKGNHQTAKSEVETIMLDVLFKQYINPTDKVLVKIDIEGAEFCMFDHEPTLQCFERTDYFAFELHHEMEYYTEEEKVAKRKQISDFIKRLSKTHSIIHETVHLFGTKK